MFTSGLASLRKRAERKRVERRCPSDWIHRPEEVRLESRNLISTLVLLRRPDYAGIGGTAAPSFLATPQAGASDAVDTPQVYLAVGDGRSNPQTGTNFNTLTILSHLVSDVDSSGSGAGGMQVTVDHINHSSILGLTSFLTWDDTGLYVHGSTTNGNLRYDIYDPFTGLTNNGNVRITGRFTMTLTTPAFTAPSHFGLAGAGLNLNANGINVAYNNEEGTVTANYQTLDGPQTKIEPLDGVNETVFSFNFDTVTAGPLFVQYNSWYFTQLDLSFGPLGTPNSIDSLHYEFLIDSINPA